MVMRKIVGAVSLLFALALAAGCLPAQPAGGPTAPVASVAEQQAAPTDGAEADQAALVQSNPRLASTLYSRIAGAAAPEQNLALAPGSVLGTLAAITAAEKGEAESELRKLLNLNAERERLKSALTEWTAQLKRDVNTAEQAFLGLQIEQDGKGVVRVKAVIPGSHAAQAGFQPGDQLVSIRLIDAPGGGEPIKSAADFVHALDAASAVVRVRCKPAMGEEYVTRRLRLVGQKKTPIAADSEAPFRSLEGVWYPSDDKPAKSFLEFVHEARGVEPYAIDFAKDAKKLRAWFSKRARPERDVTLPDGALPANLRTAFTSAVYFRPRWAASVQLGPVEEIPFTVRDRKARVPAIPFTGRFHVGKDADVQTIELPCAGSLAMAFLLPTKADGVIALEKQLSPAALVKLLSAAKLQDATVVVPEFDLVTFNDLRDPLARLGVAESFAPGAGDDDVGDKKTQKGKFAPATVLQQVQVRMISDEKEPEKAPKEAALHIRLDHAFVFLVYNRRTREVLVIGRLGNPRAA
jgi:serine protease inhibitor